MTLYEFRLLSWDEQAAATWEGHYLMARQEDSCNISLYKVYNFYVEVYYCNSSNRLLRFHSFNNKGNLERYFLPQLN
jgi:hypothetical protein